MPNYRLSICKGPDCRFNGSDAVMEAAEAALREMGLAGRCKLVRGGCYGLCHLGLNVVVREDRPRPTDLFHQEDFQLMGWEDEVHYAEMTAQGVRTVLAEHIGEDRPVDALRGGRED